jgi:hypothetical protein
MLLNVVTVAGLVLAGFGLLFGALLDTGRLTARGRAVARLVNAAMFGAGALLLVEFSLVFIGA